MHGHLVAVEIGAIERRADEWMKLDCLALDQHRLEGLNAEAMQGRCAFKSTVFANDIFQDVPYLGLSPSRRAFLIA